MTTTNTIRRTTIALMTAAATALAAGTSQAALVGNQVFTEQFDYPLSGPWFTGGSYLQGASAWNGAEGQPDSFGVNTGLDYPGKFTDGGSTGESNGLPGGEPFTSVNQQGVSGLSSLFSSAGTFYFSFLVKERMFFTIGDQSFNGNQQRTATTSTITGQLETGGGANYLATLQVNAGGGETQDGNDSGFANGSLGTHMMLFQVINDGSTGNDTISMLFDPDISTVSVADFASSIWQVTNRDITTAAAIDLYIDDASGGNRSDKAFDELLISTTLTGALGIAIPEPGTFALLVMGGLVLSHVRRSK